jgi:hypothetical protein
MALRFKKCLNINLIGENRFSEGGEGGASSPRGARELLFRTRSEYYTRSLGLSAEGSKTHFFK